MKKRMLIAGVLALAVLLVACGAGAEDRNGGTSGAASQALEASSAEGTTTSSAVPEESSGESDAAATSGGESSVTSDAGSQTESGDESEETPGVEASEPAEQSKDTSSSSGANQQPDSSHTHSYKKTVVTPTCTEKGYTKYTCSCGDSYTGDEKPKVEHSMVFSDIVDPTQTARGKRIEKCAYGCGTTKTTELYSYVELGRLISDYALQYINQYRAEEGAPKLTVSKKITEFSEYRGQQALQGKDHRSHNEIDSKLAAEATKCGIFYDYTRYDEISGETIVPCWRPDGREAWFGGTTSSWVELGNTSIADSVGKRIADGFRGSSGHWAYVGGSTSSNKDYVYVGVGTSVDSTGYVNCYVAVKDYNPDEKGYQHYYRDENDNLQVEWVKP